MFCVCFDVFLSLTTCPVLWELIFRSFLVGQDSATAELSTPDLTEWGAFDKTKMAVTLAKEVVRTYYLQNAVLFRRIAAEYTNVDRGTSLRRRESDSKKTSHVYFSAF